MITFNARGTKFSMPKSLLKNYPDTLLNNICAYDNIPVDMLNDGIFIDINPSNISTIVDIYHCREMCNLDIESIMQYMDLKFIGFDVKYHKLLPYMTEPIVHHDVKFNSFCNGTKSTYAFTNIHTIDNNIITISNNVISGWIDCKFKSIVEGYIEDYVISDSGNCIDVWIGLNAFKTHYMLSVLRDGLNYYYYDYPFTYNKKINDISTGLRSFTDMEKIDFFDSGDYNIDGDSADSSNVNYLDHKYHYLASACRKDCEIEQMIEVTDINLKLNHEEMSSIIYNIDTLRADQVDINKNISALKKAIDYNIHISNINNQSISEHFIDQKLLYFYGLLDDDSKKQLDSRL